MTEPDLSSAPGPAGVALAVMRMLAWSEVEDLRTQLQCVVTHTPWQDAHGHFGPQSLPLVPLVVRQLGANVHWAALDGASDFGELLAQTLTLPDVDRAREDAYARLLLLANTSEERFAALLAVFLLLNAPANPRRP